MAYLSPQHHFAPREKASLHRSNTGKPNWAVIFTVGVSLLMWWGIFAVAHALLR